MPAKRIVFEGTLADPEVEDGGMALIKEFSLTDLVRSSPEFALADLDDVFVRVQSWDEEARHEAWHMFDGKRVRITIQEINDGNQ